MWRERSWEKRRVRGSYVFDLRLRKEVTDMDN